MATSAPSERVRHVSGPVYTVVGAKIAVRNQAREIGATFADGRSTPDGIADRLDTSISQERMPLMDQLDVMRAAAAAGESPNV